MPMISRLGRMNWTRWNTAKSGTTISNCLAKMAMSLRPQGKCNFLQLMNNCFFVIRQWIIILGCSLMIVAFQIGASRLRTSANHKLNFDQFVLHLESVKLVLYLISSFILLHLRMLIYIQILQTTIQFAICISFIMQVLGIAKKDSLRKSAAGAAIFIFSCCIIGCIITTLGNGFEACGETPFGGLWIALIFCGLL